MKEVSVYAHSSRRWLFPRGAESVLNPNRVERYYVRAKTKKRALELLAAYTPERLTSMSALRNYGSDSWGTYIVRPTHQGEGIWLTRDHSSKNLIEVWTDK